MPVTTRATRKNPQQSAEKNPQQSAKKQANDSAEEKKSSSKPSRNVVGSTVEGYTIPEVRKSLDQIRRAWASRTDGSFSLMTKVSEHDSMYTFGMRFMLGHHRKRHQRRSKSKKTNA
jgi:hypothetical protein